MVFMAKKPDNIHAGDFIKYNGNFGIVTGENDWFFYNEKAKRYRFSKITYWGSVIPVNTVFYSNKYKLLREEYKKQTKEMVLAARKDVESYGMGTILKYVTKTGSRHYMYLGKCEYECGYLNGHVRQDSKYVYLKLDATEYLQHYNMTVSLDYIQEWIKNDMRFDAEMLYTNKILGKLSFERSTKLWCRKNLIINNVIIEGVNPNIQPFRLEFRSTNGEVWETAEFK